MPRFSPSPTTFTSGKCSSTKAREPSVEPLSTTIVSKPPHDWSRREPRQTLRNRSPFQFGMTTVMLGGTASGWPAGPLLPGLLTVDLDIGGQVHQASDRRDRPILSYLEGRRVLCAGHIRTLRVRIRQGCVHPICAGSERHPEREGDRNLLASVLRP